MLTFFRRPTAATKPTSGSRPTAAETLSAPHRQRFAIEVAYFHSPAEVADCVSVPVVGDGRRVVLYGGRGVLPPALAEMTNCVVRCADADPYAAAVVALAGVKDGDTLTVLLPADWDGPPAEALLDHARRWFASPHSNEDEQVG